MPFLREALTIFSDLVNNAILLFGLALIYAATDYRQNKQKQWRAVILGVIIGIISILIMRNSWLYLQGLFFDTRSVLLVVTGLFFGPITTLFSVVIALAYRISQGGSGVYSGVLTIITTASLGLLWPRIRKILPPMSKWLEHLFLGFIAHIVTLLCFLAIQPWSTALDVIQKTMIPYLTLYPVVTMLLAQIVYLQKERLLSQERVKQQQLLLQASIDSTKAMEVFAVDKNYNYLSFNEYHEHSMKLYYNVKIEKGKNFLEYITIPTMKDRIKACIDHSLTGEFKSYEIMVETDVDKYLEEQYSPIIDDDNHVIGVTIFSQDISERKRYEQSILYLSYRDPLTNLHNRRYFTDELVRLSQNKYFPLSIVIADINGLKIMNDAFGHDAGDLLLCTIADELIHVFKDESRIARIGGDEFVVLLPRTPYDKALLLIDEAKNKIEERTVQNMAVSVSFGLSTNEGNTPVQDTIKIAEDDMYAHKLFEVSSHRNETIKTILKTLHEKNPREEKHSERVSKICVHIGMALGMSNEEMSLLKAISNLHDIGKIAIDDAILNKPGKLDDKEWEQIKRHPEIGYRILSTSPEYAEIAQDILSHHERYDGRGYPRGLKGEEIPIRARIITVADSYDAMVSERPYRKSLTHQEAIDEIQRNLGTQFDPKIGQLFIDLYNKHDEVIQ
ncbi:MAG: diguanylate cyclase [Acholeplasmataceae bacterium]|jgi:diguanylate cyclase (GGDEF)-like protein|nr:diguanylate cyclase [Acholeplasmataceae bacterium]